MRSASSSQGEPVIDPADLPAPGESTTFSAPSTTGGDGYRVYARSSGEFTDITALPLSDVESTTKQLIAIEAVGIALLLAGLALVAVWVIRLGINPMRRMVHASAGRCTGLHYGTYDYSASLGVAAAYQSMEHPAADHAKAVMQVAAAGTGVRLSDGSTNILPVGDREAVHAAWALHARLVRRSLERGYYQGWDLHPAQLPSRYAATYAFYREGLPAAAERLRNYVGQVDSGVMDEPATARALADFVVRGLDCGATDDAEVQELTGIDRARLDVLAKRAAG